MFFLICMATDSISLLTLVLQYFPLYLNRRKYILELYIDLGQSIQGWTK